MRHAGHVEPFLGRRPPTVTLAGAVEGSTTDALRAVEQVGKCTRAGALLPPLPNPSCLLC